MINKINIKKVKFANIYQTIYKLTGDKRIAHKEAIRVINKT